MSDSGFTSKSFVLTAVLAVTVLAGAVGLQQFYTASDDTAPGQEAASVSRETNPASTGAKSEDGTPVGAQARAEEPRYSCDGDQMTAEELADRRGISLETAERIRVYRNIGPEDLCDLPETKLARAILKAENPKPDHPGEAVAFRLLQQRDENGNIPTDGLIRAAEQLHAMQRAQADRQEAAGISRNNWTWIGPGNIGGRVRAILVHPSNPNIMFAGSVSGGLWKTTNGGASWTVVSDFLSNMAISSLIMNPSNSNEMWAGTGEGFYNVDGIRGAGIMHSTDGGTTWNQLPATNSTNFLYVNRLAISPNGATLLAATQTGIFRSINGGASWTPVLVNSIGLNGEVLDIDFDPTNSNKAVAGGRTGKAWYSTDGGKNWNPVASMVYATSFYGRVELAYAKSSPLTVFASLDKNNGEVWKSTNGGQSYTLVNSLGHMPGQGWYDNALWVDPTNPNQIIVGGLDLWRSTNGGANFTQISEWQSAPNSAHADHHIIVESPAYNGTSNKTVFFGNDGGVYKTTDVSTVGGAPNHTAGWTELNNNFGVTQFYGAAGNPMTGEIIGGTQDNGTLFYTPANGTENWTSPFGGDGGFSAADPTDPNYFYGEYVYLRIHRSTDRGVSSNFIYNGITDAALQNANFIAPFILDPNNANRLLGGGASLWRSNNVKDANPTWSAIKSPGADYISAIAVVQGNSNIIYVGHNNGDVYKTTNGTAVSPTWNKIDSSLPNRYVTRIAIDPTNANNVFVSFGGYSADNVYYSSNGGTSWTNRSGSGSNALPSAPVRGLTVNPDTPAWIYAGTEVGVFASEDRGLSWSAPHDGPTNTSVDELFWLDKSLVAATHGRGLFVAGDETCKRLKVKRKPKRAGKVKIKPKQNCPQGGKKMYAFGTKVKLKAKPKRGWRLYKWTGASKSKKKKLKIFMTSDMKVKAKFRRKR
jgi:photosystem II stability/assembly factor-like uncharacterized protein